MKVTTELENIIRLFFIISSLITSYFIIRLDWKRYGVLFLVIAIIGNILCLIFVSMGFYSFPNRLFPSITKIPFVAILTIFPFYVLLGVRYSPKQWAYKIPFYWGIVHLGMLLETLAVLYTNLIRYDFKWDFWDSYTWWWIFFLIFDWIGGLIIPDVLRKPISPEMFRYGKPAWIIFHFIVIVTIFLGGFYLGIVIS